MHNAKRIRGMEQVLRRLPPELRQWHRFRNVVKLEYKQTLGGRSDIRMVLTDDRWEWFLALTLTDTQGDVHFHTHGGFFSGFTVEDHTEDGWEERCFLVTSSEPDCGIRISCSAIAAELVEGEY